jgi:2-polyprenyl-3-methyl-5-hydroxy-6-metoxy-1,4-benzoquinol methylase
MSFFSVIDEQEKNWSNLVKSYIGPGAQLVALSASSTQRRVYKKDRTIFKIVLSKENFYENTAEEEYLILKKIKHIYCVPKPISCDTYENCSILSIKEYNGEQIGQIGDYVSRFKASVVVIAKGVFSLNRQGLRHGDIHIKNFLFLPSGEIKILDYDQAVFTTPLKAFLGDFLSIGKFPAKRCALRLFIQLLLSKLSPFLWPNLGIGAFIRRLRFKKDLKELNSTHSDSELKLIWNQAKLSDSNAPGNRTSYYSLVYDDVIHQGERPWELRWAPINKAVNFKGKRLLELGCNLGLLSCYAQHAGALSGGLGVDQDPIIVAAAQNLAKFAEKDVKFLIHDFDNDDRLENAIEINNFDIVSAFSVLKWLKEKDRFLALLSHFDELLYEGHDSLDVEFSRLNSIGFYNISIITISERGRVVLFAKK